MINRILIRSKVIQIAYSYFLTKDKSVMDDIVAGLKMIDGIQDVIRTDI